MRKVLPYLLAFFIPALLAYGLRPELRPPPPVTGAVAEATRAPAPVPAPRPKERRRDEPKLKDPVKATGSMFGLVSPDGKATPIIMEYAGVRAEDYPAMQKILSDTWAEMSDLTRARLQQVDEKTVNGRQVVTYRIPHDEGEGMKIYEGLRSKFAALAGPEAADILMEGLQPGLYFSGFGQYDAEIQRTEFTPEFPSQARKTSSYRVEMKCCDRQGQFQYGHSGSGFRGCMGTTLNSLVPGL